MNRRRAAGTATGFSLLELVAVLAIFSVVGLMGVQALNAVLGAEHRLRSVEQDVGRLSLALRLLRRDLRHAVDLPVEGGDGTPRAGLLVRVGDGALELTVSGVLQVGTPPVDGLGRVLWLFDAETGALARRIDPLSDIGPSDTPPRPVLEDITGIGFSLFDPVAGWRRIDGDLAVPASARALAVEIEHRRHGTFRVMVTW